MKIENKSNINNAIKSIEDYFSVREIDKKSIFLVPENIVSNDYMSILLEKKNKWNTKTEKILFDLIKNEYHICESIYPLLGNYFLHLFFKKSKSKAKKKYIFQKNNIDIFLKNINYKVNKDIIKKIIDHGSKEYSIDLEKNYVDNILIKKQDNYNFNKLKYDFSLYKRKKIVTDFFCFLIDGYIENVSEIHHILEISHQTKQNFVIFCFGMSKTVKKTIYTNNMTGKTYVYPVSLEICEENLNILKDIAVLMNKNVLSSKLGQSTSQFIKEELKATRCKKIQFYNDSITIYPENHDIVIEEHKKFLSKKINNEKVEENKKYLIQRLKRLNAKKFKVYLPESILINNSKVKELQYCFSFISFINKCFNKVIINSEIYYFPQELVEIVNQKTNSLKSIIERIDLILHKGEESEKRKIK